MGPRARRALAEGLGTFFLVFMGAGAIMADAHTTGSVGHTGISLAFAFVVLAMIYAIGHLSGAHINPAVTIGFWSAGRFPGRDVAPYVAAQTAGALLAAASLRGILGPVADVGATVPELPQVPAFAVELLLTFALVFVIMAVATDDRVADGFAGLAVGLTVGLGALMGGPLTGGSMNPARSFGPAAVGGVWTTHWLYWLAPVAGAVLAARVYEFLRLAEPHPAERAEPLGVQGPLGAPAPTGGRSSQLDGDV